MRSVFVSIIALLLLVAPSATMPIRADEATLTISDVWARKTRRTTSAAVYLKIHNASEVGESLLGASSPIANMTMMHLSQETDGIMTMEMQDTVNVPTGETIAFAPGGLHIMLMGLSNPLAEGDTFPLTLSFENAGDITVSVEVTGLSGPEPKGH